jgi:hypothetical protein
MEEQEKSGMRLPITMTYHLDTITMIPSLCKWVILCLFLPIIMTGCTYTIALAHTQGSASDVIDDTSSPRAAFSIPLKEF